MKNSPSFSRLGWKVLVCAFFVVFAMCRNVPAADDPRGHIMKIGEAVDNADSQAFLELVDLDSVLQNALTAFINEAKKPENASQLPPMLTLVLGQLSGDGQSAAGLRAVLLGEARNFVLNGVGSGAFAGRKPDLTGAKGLLTPLFASASLGRKEITAIGDPYADGADWLVPFTIHDHGNEQDYAVLARVVQGPSGLVLENVENLPQLVQQIGAENAAVDRN